MNTAEEKPENSDSATASSSSEAVKRTPDSLKEVNESPREGNPPQSMEVTPLDFAVDMSRITEFKVIIFAQNKNAFLRMITPNKLSIGILGVKSVILYEEEYIRNDCLPTVVTDRNGKKSLICGIQDPFQKDIVRVPERHNQMADDFLVIEDKLVNITTGECQNALTVLIGKDDGLNPLVYTVKSYQSGCSDEPSAPTTEPQEKNDSPPAKKDKKEHSLEEQGIGENRISPTKVGAVSPDPAASESESKLSVGLPAADDASPIPSCSNP